MWAWLWRLLKRPDDQRVMGYDVRRDENGKLMWLDTESNWRDFTDRTDREVAREVDYRGPNLLPFNRPSGMAADQADWNLWWLDTFERHRRYQDNPERYIAYSVRARREAGLPELIRPEERPS
ncbi:hypothetical protein ADK67_22340 [Saccharothrix sp. NRRL B-16348]|nr:hypothetical protein ADK67_22340 [Saccharothrix sp. NRRL B-16348]